MMRALAISVAVVLLVIEPALAQGEPQSTPTRVHGEIEKLDGRALSVKTPAGSVVTIALEADLAVTAAVAKDSADIKTGDYVGVGAVSGMGGKRQAIEVLIFPEAMRGVAEGEFAWPHQFGGRITNGAVTGISETPPTRTLTLSHKGRESEIVVAPEARVIAAQPADVSLLKPGTAVFLIAQRYPDGRLTAGSITAERDGVKPPM